MEKIVYIAFSKERVISRYNSLQECYDNQVNGFIWNEEVAGIDIYRINKNEKDDFLYFLDLAYTQECCWNDEDKENWERYNLHRFYEKEIEKIDAIFCQDYVPIFKTIYGEVEGLPEEIAGVYYIVSMLVKQACPSRKDLLSPSQLVRDSEGKIIGCLGLE